MWVLWIYCSDNAVECFINTIEVHNRVCTTAERVRNWHLFGYLRIVTIKHRFSIPTFAKLGRKVILLLDLQRSSNWYVFFYQPTNSKQKFETHWLLLFCTYSKIYYLPTLYFSIFHESEIYNVHFIHPHTFYKCHVNITWRTQEPCKSYHYLRHIFF